ncbi:hypothetical protein PbB2_02929 [Candidatus Phycosocius bacilliformis]|uniref:Uncharacterized protein n=1 Tax=Candidatus Phycosocius bacilliformis TaxID=1445552 RepID=A0A2P2EDV0_9PROT|nr:hypothetical protein PbB2_02929 [Candidatus Phycosocius bacilliformis]
MPEPVLRALGRVSPFILMKNPFHARTVIKSLLTEKRIFGEKHH